MLHITPLYAGLIALLYIAQSAWVIQRRGSGKISIGDGGDADMFKRIRVHANSAEYAPLGLLLLAMAEIQGLPGWLLHLFGATFLLGRLLHAYGLGSTPQVVPARFTGMVLTFTVLLCTALANIGYALF